MAEVVQADRRGQGGVSEGGVVAAAADVVAVEHRAACAREDERLELAARGLGGVVLAEEAGDEDAPGVVALRRADPAVLGGAGDVERGAVPADVAPFKSECLADTQAGADQDLS